jgi:L-fucose/D-arabinose isomerase
MTKKIKVGFYSLCDHRSDKSRFIKRDKECVEWLKKSGLEVVHINNRIISCENESVEAVRFFKNEAVDCVIYYVSWFLESNIIATPIRMFGIPSIIWSVPDPETYSMIGMGVVHGSLDEAGLKHKFIYNYLNEHTIKSIKSYASAARAKKRLIGSRYCQFGGRCLSMYTAVADPSQWKEKFGVEVEHKEQWTLVQEAEKIDDDKALELVKQYKKDFGQVDPSDDVLLKSAKVYIALKDILKKERFDFAGIKCQFEMIDNYIAPCLALSMLNDENIVVSCEADMNAAITMFILNILSNQPVSFNDISYIDKVNQIIRLLNCGMLPTSFARSKKEIKLRNMVKGMGSYDEEKGVYRTKGGACTNFICRPGEVTLARFARISGEYVCQIAKGKTFIPKDFFKKGIWGSDCLPWAFVEFSGDMENFIQNIRSNHIHMVYGDYLQELKDVCELLNVSPILCS